tara:strand:- start:8705 stop:9091 length:387 start_codon:yes stop_codon:yes gene_type:complete
MDKESYLTTGIAAAILVSSAATVYYYNDKLFPDTSTEEFDNSDKKTFYEVEIEAYQNYDIESDFEVCWDDKDVSEWKFSKGGYFIVKDRAILPSYQWQNVDADECTWVVSQFPIKLLVTKKVIKKSIK